MIPLITGPFSIPHPSAFPGVTPGMRELQFVPPVDPDDPDDHGKIYAILLDGDTSTALLVHLSIDAGETWTLRTPAAMRIKNTSASDLALAATGGAMSWSTALLTPGAIATLTFTDGASNGDTVTIGSSVYTYHDGANYNDLGTNEILRKGTSPYIFGDRVEDAERLVYAIRDASPGSGTYSQGTVVNPDCLSYTTNRTISNPFTFATAKFDSTIYVMRGANKYSVLGEGGQGALYSGAIPTYLSRWDTATDDWMDQLLNDDGTPGDPLGPTIYQLSSVGVQNDRKRSRHFALLARSTGYLVAAFNGSIETIGGTDWARAYYSIWDGATWSAQVLIAGATIDLKDYFASQLHLGDLDSVHIFLSVAKWSTSARPGTFSSGGLRQSLFHVTLTSADVLQTVQEVVVETLDDPLIALGLGHTSPIRAVVASVTNAVMDATDDKKISTGSYSFVATDVGASLKVVGGPAGWVNGLYTVVSIDGTAAILDASPAPVSSVSGDFQLTAGRTHVTVPYVNRIDALSWFEPGIAAVQAKSANVPVWDVAQVDSDMYVDSYYETGYLAACVYINGIPYFAWVRPTDASYVGSQLVFTTPFGQPFIVYETERPYSIDRLDVIDLSGLGTGTFGIMITVINQTAGQYSVLPQTLFFTVTPCPESTPTPTVIRGYSY